MVLEMLLTEMWMSLYKVSQQLKFMPLVQCTGQIEAKSIPNARGVARGGGRRFDRYITVIFFVQKSFSNVYRLVGIYFLVCKQSKFCFLV